MSTAARKQTFNRGSMTATWRVKAYGAILICWKKMNISNDRDERLEWIRTYLGLKDLGSIKDLTDDQLGAVAGEMKRLTGQTSSTTQRGSTHPSTPRSSSTGGRVVQVDFGRPSASEVADHETIHLASPEQVYTLDKLDRYIAWSEPERNGFLKRRYKTTTFRMMTFHQATAATNALLQIAAHRDLKRSRGKDEPVSRAEMKSYIPKLKAELGIGQRN